MTHFTPRSCSCFGLRQRILALLLLVVLLAQYIPDWGEFYARRLYPGISFVLTSFSSRFPFAVGDLFIFLSIVGLLVYPYWARLSRKKTWKRIALAEVEYLLWLYVWFYAAWGLNYSQKDFYERTGISRVEFSSERFRTFADNYVKKLNASYTKVTFIHEGAVCKDVVAGYNVICDSFGIHRPTYQFITPDTRSLKARRMNVKHKPYHVPRVKTMLFSSLASKVGVTGSMAPFFCEFTLNGDLPHSQYPATYAHELAHHLGITSEAEANFYAFKVCTYSMTKDYRFSGYLFLLPHVLSNARRLMDEEEYAALVASIRPEVMEQMKQNREYWREKYSPTLGKLQDFFYDLYLRGNKIESGRQNYSEVIGLLISTGY